LGSTEGKSNTNLGKQYTRSGT